MLYPSLYEELDIDRYAIMAQDMLPACNVLIALTDDSGQIAWINNDNHSLSTLLRDYREWECVPVAKVGCECVTCQREDSVIAYCALGELSGKTVTVRAIVHVKHGIPSLIATSVE